MLAVSYALIAAFANANPCDVDVHPLPFAISASTNGISSLKSTNNGFSIFWFSIYAFFLFSSERVYSLSMQ
jgi:hypothetical protein